MIFKKWWMKHQYRFFKKRAIKYGLVWQMLANECATLYQGKQEIPDHLIRNLDHYWRIMEGWRKKEHDMRHELRVKYGI